jgi:hypothetical protein
MMTNFPKKSQKNIDSVAQYVYNKKDYNVRQKGVGESPTYDTKKFFFPHSYTR